MLGEKRPCFETNGVDAWMTFQAKTNVQKPLAAATRITEKGNRIVLDDADSESYIQNKKTGKKIPVDIEKRGLYYANAYQAYAFSKAGQDVSCDELSFVAARGKTIRPVGNLEARLPKEQEYGVRNPRKLPDPKMPSKEEVAQRYLTHLPFRNWCQYCVQGKESGTPLQTESREGGLMEVHFDYCIMSTHCPLATILVARGKPTKMTLATVVPMKGASVEHPVRRTLTFLKEIGLERADVVFKSDQEPALKDLLNTIAARRTAKSKTEKFDKDDGPADGAAPGVGRTIHESSLVGTSQSNGMIERAIQDVDGQVRTLKLAFESHLVEKVQSDHNSIPWLVQNAAVLLNRWQVGQDGKTAYERLKDKPANLPGMEFGKGCFGERISRLGIGGTGWTPRLRKVFIWVRGRYRVSTW